MLMTVYVPLGPRSPTPSGVMTAMRLTLPRPGESAGQPVRPKASPTSHRSRLGVLSFERVIPIAVHGCQISAEGASLAVPWMGDDGPVNSSEILARLGHVNYRVDQKDNHPTKWIASCQCGYASTIRRTEQLAWEAAVHHAKTTVLDVRRRAQMAGMTEEDVVLKIQLATPRADKVKPKKNRTGRTDRYRFPPPA